MPNQGRRIAARWSDLRTTTPNGVRPSAPAHQGKHGPQALRRPQNRYGRLGVTRDADTPAIREAYTAASRVHHPDKGGGDTDSKALNVTYDILRAATRRQHYDADCCYCCYCY